MALPLVPIAGVALRYGAVALAAYMLTRQVHPGRTDQRAEDALDDLPEGVSTHRPRDRDQINGAARVRRVIRLGTAGPGVEVDLTALGRLRFRRL
ncbi:hypothetical protein [Rhodobaculum claviforme]|uniref:Uncharacterized protein n=1 Tax=Rhodobaculum claviforme TaxID=1549854 RepID=A0A934TIW5_9RHOB|nr:hypothetical protein [Rhodobaculum claviforme]MBK5926306.1 hypothetical protein [Rhodobaculum claviforme]